MLRQFVSDGTPTVNVRAVHYFRIERLPFDAEKAKIATLESCRVSSNACEQLIFANVVRILVP